MKASKGTVIFRCFVALVLAWFIVMVLSLARASTVCAERCRVDGEASKYTTEIYPSFGRVRCWCRSTQEIER